MKKILSAIMISVPMLMWAQGATDAYSITQTDLKGTARFVSMAGAMGALGGDLSAIQLNPGGIGVYRSNDAGFTLNFDAQSAESVAKGNTTKMSQTKFNINSMGLVWSFERNSGILPFLNVGITYNRPLSYNRRYGGKISDIKTSLTNYIADVTNRDGYTDYDLEYIGNSSPYEDSDARWLSIMAYNSYLINPKDSYTEEDYTYGYNFKGLMNSKSSGFSEYEVIEEGGVNEFNIHLGGNISNVVHLGVALGYNSLNFSKYTYYGEAINNATVMGNKEGDLDHKGTASWGLENWLNTSGDAWNFKFGVIARPFHELRVGLAFHLPTHYSLKDEITSSINFETVNSTGDFVKTGYENANDGYGDMVKYRIRTPWKMNLSVASVVGEKGLLSLTYERIEYNSMKIAFENEFGFYDEDAYTSHDITKYYKGINIFRLGGEYRLFPSLSLRAGYSYQNSPVREEAIKDRMQIVTSGTTPAYAFDKATQYITAGVGFKVNGFYADFAYALKLRTSEYRAFSPSNTGPSYESGYQYTPAPSATVKDYNSQIVCSMGYRF